MPGLLIGFGLAELFVLHGVILGILLTALGAAGFVLHWVGGRLKAAGQAAAAATGTENLNAIARRELKRRLLRLQGAEGCESLAESAAGQLLQSDEKSRSFDKLLRARLDPSELTFSRYHGAQQQVALALADRLGEIADLLSSIESIHLEETRSRLRALGEAAEGAQEAALLRQRVQVAETQLGKARGLLLTNEQALNELDRANVALTEMKTQAGQASTQLEEALKQLEQLAGQAGRYSS